MRLHLESETVGRTGGITGTGAKKVIGAPHIDSLEVVIREAVQNSWDAAERGAIRFGISAFEVTGRTKTAVTQALAAGIEERPPIIQLPRGPLDALLVWDKDTSGLGGAVRPDEADDSERDFVRFVYMIGDTKSQTEALAKGGTYGFGRSSFLTASRLGTILLYSVCTYKGRRQPRFIGMTWSDSERSVKARYTGRHWWGGWEDRHVVPLIGREASAMAAALQMDVFGGDDFGTAIMILAPRWSSEEDVAAARRRMLEQIKTGILWNCWPRLLDKTIKFSLDWFGEEIAVPDPADDPRLKVFARAFEIAHRPLPPVGALKKNVECLKPVQKLGTLALVKTPFLADRQDDPDADDGRPERDGRTPLCHIAMMRGTRLVIHYLEVASPPDGMQYAGVFLADPSIDSVFAMSEPPAHDEWVKERLTGSNRTLVNVTYKRVQEFARDFVRPPSQAATDGSQADFGLLADSLGGLFVEVEGDGGQPISTTGTGGLENRGGGGTGRVQIQLQSPEVSGADDDLELTVPIRITTRGNRTEVVILTARTSVSIEGGVEKDAPKGAASPTIIGWKLSRTAPPIAGDSIRLEIDGSRDCSIVVRQPRDCSARLSVEVT